MTQTQKNEFHAKETSQLSITFEWLLVSYRSYSIKEKRVDCPKITIGNTRVSKHNIILQPTSTCRQLHTNSFVLKRLIILKIDSDRIKMYINRPFSTVDR